MPRRRGRPQKPEVLIRVELHLPHDIVGWLNQQTFDFKTGRAKYGARAELIERLIRQEMAKPLVDPAEV